MPTLEVTIHHAAIYWDEVKCSFEARPGKILYDETNIISSYYFSHGKNSYALEILSVADDEISFIVKAIFCHDDKDKVETIHPGEVKKFMNTYKSSCTWDGDEIDYEVEDWMEIKWV